MSTERALSRRRLLRLGAASTLGLGWGLPSALARARSAPWQGTPAARACILIWLDGGPSHLDSFDPKPEAPSAYRGDFAAIESSLDGVRICEHLPRIAKRLDRTALVRSLSSLEGNHDRGSHHYLTGFHPSQSLVYPSLGSILAHQYGVGAGGVPTYVTLGQTPQYGGPGYLGQRFAPYETAIGGSRGALPEGLDAARLERRRVLRERVEQASVGGERSELDSFYAQAFDLLTSKRALDAFDLSQEPAASRARFEGAKLATACLTARRLVEAGSRFVTVYSSGWDTHEDNFARLTTGYPGPLTSIDIAFSALLDDLEQRGMLDETLILMMGEFGRTPKINAKGGRDHWPRANCCLLAGGGIRTGQVVGGTDARGELPVTQPIEPPELLATVYRQLGVTLSESFTTPSGRRVTILPDGAEPIEELIA